VLLERAPQEIERDERRQVAERRTERGGGEPRADAGVETTAREEAGGGGRGECDPRLLVDHVGDERPQLARRLTERRRDVAGARLASTRFDPHLNARAILATR